MTQSITTLVLLFTAPGGLRWRLVFAVLGAMGMAIIYGLKVNLSVTVVAMINATALEELAKAEATALGAGNNASGHDHGTVHDGIDPDDMCFDPNAKADAGAKNEVSAIFLCSE